MAAEAEHVNLPINDVPVIMRGDVKTDIYMCTKTTTFEKK